MCAICIQKPIKTNTNFQFTKLIFENTEEIQIQKQKENSKVIDIYMCHSLLDLFHNFRIKLGLLKSNFLDVLFEDVRFTLVCSEDVGNSRANCCVHLIVWKFLFLSLALALVLSLTSVLRPVWGGRLVIRVVTSFFTCWYLSPLTPWSVWMSRPSSSRVKRHFSDRFLKISKFQF